MLCEGCEGEILGKGGSFIPKETIEKVLAVEIPTASPIASPTPPGFVLVFAVIAIAVVVLLAKRRR